MASVAQTEGVILSAAVGAGQSRYRASSGGYHYRTSYHPDITYQYTVNGQQYINNRFAQRPTLINRESIIQRVLEKYPVGQKVTVYYNPANPQDAYLQKGMGGAATAIVLGALLLTALIAVVVVWIVFVFGV